MRLHVLLLLALSLSLFACGEEKVVEIECEGAETLVCETTCGSTGLRTCQEDNTYGPCLPPAETCNGLDDDCDDEIDEGLVGCATAEGSGGTGGTGGEGGDDACTTPGLTQDCLTDCSSVGTQTCTGAKKWGPCVPPDEECNGKDDDCNNSIDDGLAQECTTACGKGTETCQSGTWSGCSAPAPQAETCNGVDDDCDSVVDEAESGEPLTEACTSPCGAGVKTCASGAFGECSSQGSAEICDGLDNDCNGQTDDAPGGCDCNPGETQPCGAAIGECTQGTQECFQGKWLACTGSTGTEELCDGLDNDCDGQTDDTDVTYAGAGQVCGSDVEEGPCKKGVTICEGGQIVCKGGVDATAEICDDVDNDCDGQTDEDAENGDDFEDNDACGAPYDLGKVIEGQGPTTWQANLYPGPDADWYQLEAAELSGITFGDEAFTLKITLKDIPTGDYDLCVWDKSEKSCGDLPGGVEGSEAVCEDLGIFKLDTTPEVFEVSWPGEFLQNDDREFLIKVVAYDPGDADCKPYTLEAEMVGN